MSNSYSDSNLGEDITKKWGSKQSVPTRISNKSSESDFSENNEYVERKFHSVSKGNFEFNYKESTTVYDVASYILKKMGTISTMKLQKLVYYCQAWSLVWDEKPLFKEPIEAWANGPVIRKLFYYHQGFFEIDSISIGNPDVLNEKQKATIDAVLDFYGNKTAQWLIDLTHLEEPWKITRGTMSLSERGDKEIPLDVIANYYSSLSAE